MGRVDEQIKKEKHPLFIFDLSHNNPGLKRVELSCALLDEQAYEQLLKLWVAGQMMTFPREQYLEPPMCLWRKEFVDRLKNEKEAWKEMIFKGIVRRTPSSSRKAFSSEDRDTISEALIDDSKPGKPRLRDPLELLNLCGVPPYGVLGELEDLKVAIEEFEPFKRMLRSKKEREDDVRLLCKAASRMELYDRYLTEKTKAGSSHSLRERASIIEHAEQNGALPLLRRGSPIKTEHSLTVKFLFNCCRQRIEMERLEEHKWRSGKANVFDPDAARVLVKKDSLRGVIAAIMCAAFPKGWGEKKDPIENVKNTIGRRISMQECEAERYKESVMIGMIKGWC